MKLALPRHRSRLAAFLLALSSTGVCAGDGARAASATPSGVEYTLTLVNGAPYIDLSIDGSAGTFLFDTGANTSGVDAGWLGATGIWYWAGAPTTLGGTTGALSADTAIFDVLDLGDAVYERPSFTIQDFSGFVQPPGRVQAGLLGTDFIDGFEVTLDLAGGHVWLATQAERGAAPHGATAVPIDYVLGLPTVPVTVGGAKLSCRLDSGSAYEDDRPFLDVNEAAVRAIAATGQVLVKTGEVTIVGVSGPETRDLLEGPAWSPITLGVGSKRVRGVVLVVDQDGTVGSSSEPLALAGAPILSRIGRVTLDPFEQTMWVGGR